MRSPVPLPGDPDEPYESKATDVKTEQSELESYKHKVWRLEAHVDVLTAALQTIRGPQDEDIWMIPYREAGGGYAGLQAIARSALGED